MLSSLSARANLAPPSAPVLNESATLGVAHVSAGAPCVLRQAQDEGNFGGTKKSPHPELRRTHAARSEFPASNRSGCPRPRLTRAWPAPPPRPSATSAPSRE